MTFDFPSPPPTLRRHLGLAALIVYGIGDMLGGGIYALTGKVAGVAGGASWLSFALAMAVAAPTAFSYAELASRHPRSGGESWFCQVAFRREWLATLVGWMVMFSGIVSTAMLARAFGGYGHDLVPRVPVSAFVLLFVGCLALINLRGIALTSWANILCTAIETSGLLIVLILGMAFLFGGHGSSPDPVAGLAGAAASEDGRAGVGVLQGALLAFYAFIGFEDMVNVAEEVREPRRNLPIAILVALGVVGMTYVAVSWVATAVVPPAELAQSGAPLMLVVGRAAPWIPPATFTVIALFALSNTALLNFVTTSRLAYGMAAQGLLPAGLRAVHDRYRTPHRAVALVSLLAAGFALSATVVLLAGTTSVLLLAVFLSMNASLLAIKRAEGPHGGFTAPRFIPVTGAILSIALVAFAPLASVASAAVLVALGVGLALAWRRGG